MKKLFLLWCCSIILLFLLSTSAFAVYDPLSVPNNKVGIHILFPSELQDAAKLINSQGGDWGYVTIPIQAGDKDIKKWQSFFDACKQLHVIPLVRLATEGDYFNTSVWRKPTLTDVLDFANFLNSLSWPTKNRYIIVYNEVNRGDEWGGQADPSDYANLLTYAVTVFKSKSPDFFIISAGLDNAAINSSTTYNEYTFLEDMNQTVPGIFNQIDGIASHSYPNPGFSQPPSVQTAESISSFLYERNFIANMSSKSVPTFITETGWSSNAINPATIASYYQEAFSSVWTDPQIVAITPFLLKAGGNGPFSQFSFVDQNGNPDGMYASLSTLAKTKGQPETPPSVLAAATTLLHLPTKDFSKNSHENLAFFVSQGEKSILKWFLHW